MEQRPSWEAKTFSTSQEIPCILVIKSFRKPLGETQVSLKSGENDGYVTQRHFHVYDNISLSS
jgi:hypothetical protein